MEFVISKAEGRGMDISVKNKDQRLVRSRARHGQTGVGLADTLLAIVIGSFLISGAGLLYFYNINDQKIDRAMRQFIITQSAVRNLYSGSASFENLDNDLMFNSGYMPPEITTDTPGTFNNIWGGDITVASFPGNVTRFTIAFEEVPVEACVRIATITAPQGAGSVDGLEVLTIDAGGGPIDFTPPITVTEAITACNDPDDNTTLIWRMF